MAMPDDAPIFATLILSLDIEADIRDLQTRISSLISTQTRVAIHRPHLTISACRRGARSRLLDTIERICHERRRFPLEIRAIGAFKETNTLFVLPTLSRELLDVHAAVHETVETLYPHHLAAGAWIPHVTVAAGLIDQELHSAFGLLLERFRTLNGFAEGIGLVDSAASDDTAAELLDSAQHRFRS